MFTPPAEVEAVGAVFASLFTRPGWRCAQALLCGVLLAPVNPAVTSAGRAPGLSCGSTLAKLSPRSEPGTLVGSPSRGHFTAPAPARFRARGSGRARPRRDGGAAARREDQGAGHLPRCGAFQPGVFPEESAHPRSPGAARVGLAFSDRPLSPGTLRARRAARPAASAVDRACPRTDRPDPALAARPGARRRRGPRLRRPGVAGLVRAVLPHPVTIITRLRLDAALYEPAPARQPRPDGSSRPQGQTPAHARQSAGGS